MLLHLLAFAAAAELSFTRLDTPEGPIEYAVLVPETKGPRVGLLALPPGPQTREMAQAGLHDWAEDMLKQGLVVVAPVAPPSGAFPDPASYNRLPHLMDHVAREHNVKGAWYLFGISNGGRSALALAPAHPNRFRSVTVLPGAASNPALLAPLADIPVTLVVGSDDTAWLSQSQVAHDVIHAAGGNAELVVLQGQGHYAFKSVDWPTLWGWISR
jgi:pimeloyl-ACP methyl ester carboxylesterase